MAFDLGEAKNPSCVPLQLSTSTQYGTIDPSMENKATNHVRFIESIHETFVQNHYGCFHCERSFPILFINFFNIIF